MSVVFTKPGTPDVVVTINKNPSYDSKYYTVRKNQYSQETVDGVLKVYDGGPSVVYGTVVLKNVAKAEGDALMSFIKSNLVFQLNTFTIAPPANTDLGNGVGTSLTSCNFDGGQSLDGVFEFIPPGKYNINFPYRKVL